MLVGSGVSVFLYDRVNPAFSGSSWSVPDHDGRQVCSWQVYRDAEERHGRRGSMSSWEDRGVWWALARAWVVRSLVGAGADTHLRGRVDSSSSRTGDGTGKGERYAQSRPELNLQKYRSSSWRRASQHIGISPIPVMHVIGLPGAIPPVHPTRQMSYRSHILGHPKSTLYYVMYGPRHWLHASLLRICLGSRRSLPCLELVSWGMGKDVQSPSAHFRGPENRRIEGQLASFLRVLHDGRDCIASHPPLCPCSFDVPHFLPSETS